MPIYRECYSVAHLHVASDSAVDRGGGLFAFSLVHDVVASDNIDSYVGCGRVRILGEVVLGLSCGRIAGSVGHGDGRGYLLNRGILELRAIDLKGVAVSAVGIEGKGGIAKRNVAKHQLNSTGN